MVKLETIKKLPLILKPTNYEQDANAAVALLLKSSNEDFEILLVKRAVRASDVWSGQMALPGGKHEPEDPTLKVTAIRETFEETGIDIEECCFLGVLDAVHPMTGSDFLVLPFVVILENDPEIKLNRNELDSYLWFPYEKLSQYQNKTTQVNLGEVPAFIFQDAVIWGMTYKILLNFSKTVTVLKEM